jgi:hypothetical protein
VEVGAGVWLVVVLRLEEEERGHGGDAYPTSIRTKVSASRTLLPFVPPWGFDAFSSFDFCQRSPLSTEMGVGGEGK